MNSSCAPYDFLKVRPTFMDAWPVVWRNLSLPMLLVSIDRVECNALGWQIAGHHHLFEQASPMILSGIVERLDMAIFRMGGACCIRLVSRSPKDSLRAQRFGLRVANGLEALALILEGSQRCADDLRMALDHDFPMAIVVRGWLDFPAWCELRCYVHERRWVAASQANVLRGIKFPDPDIQLPQMLLAVRRIMTPIIDSSPMAEAVFDIVCQRDSLGNWASVLLDVNPLLPVTDLPLYTSVDEFDDCCRVSCDDGIRSFALPSL